MMNSQSYRDQDSSYIQEEPVRSNVQDDRTMADDEPIILEATVHNIGPDPMTSQRSPDGRFLPEGFDQAEGLGPAEQTRPLTEIPQPLIAPAEVERYRSRWQDIQGKFVDEPTRAVEQADAMVSEVIAQLTQMLATEQNSLAHQWHQGQNVSTEDLRVVLQHYRAFFNRLTA